MERHSQCREFPQDTLEQVQAGDVRLNQEPV